MRPGTTADAGVSTHACRSKGNIKWAKGKQETPSMCKTMSHNERLRDTNIQSSRIRSHAHLDDHNNKRSCSSCTEARTGTFLHCSRNKIKCTKYLCLKLTCTPSASHNLAVSGSSAASRPTPRFSHVPALVKRNVHRFSWTEICPRFP